MPTVLITGASRGIGLEFVRQYSTAGWDVIACVRDPVRATELADVRRLAAGTVAEEPLHDTHAQQLEWLVGKYAETSIDVLINNAAEIGPRGANRENLHRQFFGSLDYDAWRRVLEVNVLAPVRIAEAFAEHVERSTQKKMVFLSSTVGSIAEGRQPVFAYASSKAALNKCVSMIAMSVADRGIVAAALCPGHVKTELGGRDATLEARDSVAAMRRLIAQLAPADSGSFTRWDGTRIAW